MITTLGKTHILSYLAGLSPAIAQSISVGVGSAAPSAGDTSLHLEVDRLSITSTAIDPVTNKIIFKATLPSGTAVLISELGLWSSDGESDAYLAATFGDFDEPWEGGAVEESEHSRFNSTLYNLSISGATPVTANLLTDSMDLSDFFGPRDRWTLGLYKTGAAPVKVALRLISTPGAYADMNFFPTNNSSTGYIIASTNAGDATVTGAFDPSSVTSYEIIVTPAAGNAISSVVGLDVISVSNAPEERGGSVLVARHLVTPFRTSPESPTDVEFELGVGIST